MLVALAVLSAVGGFVALPSFLAPLLPLPEVVPSLEHLETPLVAVSIAIALAGLGAAAFVYGDRGARAEALRRRFPRLYRVLSGKYFVDEAYERAIARPLLWVSDRVFLRLGDQMIFDGTLHGLAALGRRAAGGLSRVQNGNLHRYALLVLLGLVAALLSTWHHG